MIAMIFFLDIYDYGPNTLMSLLPVPEDVGLADLAPVQLQFAIRYQGRTRP